MINKTKEAVLVIWEVFFYDLLSLSLSILWISTILVFFLDFFFFFSFLDFCMLLRFLDQGSVLVKDRDVNLHRGFETKLFNNPNGAQDNNKDFPLRAILSSYYFDNADNKVHGIPDGKSDCRWEKRNWGEKAIKSCFRFNFALISLPFAFFVFGFQMFQKKKKIL